MLTFPVQRVHFFFPGRCAAFLVFGFPTFIAE
jgi:hypothetical protein